jgi:hypothetical protein
MGMSVSGGGISADQLRREITALIAALILLIVGMVVINITNAMGTYVLSTLNTSNVTVYPLVSQASLSIVGTIFLLVGIAILIVAVVWILKSLIAVTGEIGKTS